MLYFVFTMMYFEFGKTYLVTNIFSEDYVTDHDGNSTDHVHPGEVGGHGEGGQPRPVLEIDRRPTLHHHVEHLNAKVRCGILWVSNDK